MAGKIIKSYYSRFISYLKDWRNLILVIYLWFVLMAYAIVYIDFSSFEARKRFYIVTVAEVILIALLYICPKIMRFAERIFIMPDKDTLSSGDKFKFFVRTWLIFFAAFFVIYIIFYPGGFSGDSIWQYGQAKGLTHYNDWHPVLHTLFAFTLPLKLSGGWVGSVALFQIIIFSGALAYMFSTILEYSSKKYTRIVLIYTLVSPATLGISVCMYKDTSFAAMAVIAMTMAIRIYFTNGKWLNDTKHMILFVIILTVATIFRHNAILFTLPLLLAVIFFAQRWRKIFMPVLFLALLFMIKWPLYSYLNVEAPGYRQFETLGVPLEIINTAARETPERLDPDILDFAKKYNSDYVEETGYAKILNMAFRCLKQSPFVSIKAFADVTDLVYGISGVFVGGCVPYIRDNSYGIQDNGIYFLERLFYFYSYGSMMTMKHIFWHLGVLHLVIIILVLAKLSFKDKRILFILPMFMYNFGTMLLLKINDFRFFYYSLPVMPLIIMLILLQGRRDKSGDLSS